MWKTPKNTASNLQSAVKFLKKATKRTTFFYCYYATTNKEITRVEHSCLKTAIQDSSKLINHRSINYSILKMGLIIKDMTCVL